MGEYLFMEILYMDDLIIFSGKQCNLVEVAQIKALEQIWDEQSHRIALLSQPLLFSLTNLIHFEFKQGSRVLTLCILPC